MALIYFGSHHLHLWTIGWINMGRPASPGLIGPKSWLPHKSSMPRPRTQAQRKKLDSSEPLSNRNIHVALALVWALPCLIFLSCNNSCRFIRNDFLIMDGLKYCICYPHANFQQATNFDLLTRYSWFLIAWLFLWNFLFHSFWIFWKIFSLNYSDLVLQHLPFFSRLELRSRNDLPN